MRKTGLAPFAVAAVLALAGCNRSTEPSVPLSATGAPSSELAKIDAETALADALTTAKTQDKVLLVHFSAPG